MENLLENRVNVTRLAEEDVECQNRLTERCPADSV